MSTASCRRQRRRRRRRNAADLRRRGGTHRPGPRRSRCAFQCQVTHYKYSDVNVQFSPLSQSRASGRSHVPAAFEACCLSACSDFRQYCAVLLFMLSISSMAYDSRLCILPLGCCTANRAYTPHSCSRRQHLDEFAQRYLYETRAPATQARTPTSCGRSTAQRRATDGGSWKAFLAARRRRAAGCRYSFVVSKYKINIWKGEAGIQLAESGGLGRAAHHRRAAGCRQATPVQG